MTFFTEEMGKPWPSFRSSLVPGDVFVLACDLSQYHEDTRDGVMLEHGTVYLIVARPEEHQFVILDETSRLLKVML